jgi:hypothetical protein
MPTTSFNPVSLAMPDSRLPSLGDDARSASPALAINSDRTIATVCSASISISS